LRSEGRLAWAVAGFPCEALFVLPGGAAVPEGPGAVPAGETPGEGATSGMTETVGGSLSKSRSSLPFGQGPSW